MEKFIDTPFLPEVLRTRSSVYLHIQEIYSNHQLLLR